jgi:hypothetical protein
MSLLARYFGLCYHFVSSTKSSNVHKSGRYLSAVGTAGEHRLAVQLLIGTSRVQRGNRNFSMSALHRTSRSNGLCRPGCIAPQSLKGTSGTRNCGNSTQVGRPGPESDCKAQIH